MDEFERRMDLLRVRFAERAGADGEALRNAWASRDLDALRRIAHGLAGNAGLFGYTDLGMVARELEEALDKSGADLGLRAKVEAVLAHIPFKPGE